MKLEFVIDDSYDGKTVKHVLKSRFKMSERLVKKLKYNNRILLNSAPAYIKEKVGTGDVLEVDISFEEESEGIIPQEIPLDIIYEDDCLIAVDKNPGIVVHPTVSHPFGTLANGLVRYLSGKGINVKVRPVNRLDRDTSGIVLFALNQYVQEMLVRQMKENTFIKEYLGIVHGTPTPREGTIDLPIDRKPGSIMLREISPGGYPSVTHYRVVESLGDYSLVEFRLKTGRTHQIRVHCQAAGFPLLGDTLYSDIPTDLISRQALHSASVGFSHPITGKPVVICSPLPEDMRRVLEILRK